MGSATISWDETEGATTPGALKLTTVALNDRAQTSPNFTIATAGSYTLTFKVK